MSLKQKIEADLKEAMKNKEELRLSVLRMLASALRNRQLEKRTKLAKDGTDSAKLEARSELEDDEAMEVVRSESKKRKDAAEGFERGGRAELAEKERQELLILQAYLPQELSDAELHKLVSEAIFETSASAMKDFGKVMGYVMGHAKNQVSGDRVSAAVKKVLGN